MTETTGIAWWSTRKGQAEHVVPRPGKKPFQWRFMSLKEILKSRSTRKTQEPWMIRIIIILLMLTNSAVGQQLTVDLKKIEPQLAMQILEAQKKNDAATTAASVATSSNVINQAKEWADVGNAVGIGIAATAKSLSVEINDFVKTPVGQWAFFFLFWFIIGHKIWSVVAGIIIWIVLGSIIWHSFTIFHRPKQITVDDGRGGKRAELVYRFNSNDARATSAVAHVITFMFLSIVMILVIL